MPTLLDLLGLWKHPGGLPGRREARRSTDALIGELKLRQEEWLRWHGEAALRGNGDVSSERLRGSSESRARVDGGRRAPERPIPVVGSGLVGDSLFGPDYRGCAVGATHYGAKTLAVVAGDWKGLFVYTWKKEGDYTHAEVRSGFSPPRFDSTRCLSFRPSAVPSGRNS